MAEAIRSGFAKGEGTNLYFERRGSGPALVMIAGGGGDCSVFSAIGKLLATSYTVLTYDRRGNSRSPLLGSPTKITLAEQSSDALTVLRANGFESALVFGNSGGAEIALDLASRYPRTIEAVVPHEPPTPKILPDAGDILASYDEIDRVMQKEGWAAAFKLFLAINRLTPPGKPEAAEVMLNPEKFLPPSPHLDLLKRQTGNWEYMMKYEVRSFIDFVPDLEKIVGSEVRIGMAAGVDTRGQYPHRASEVIAEKLGAEFVEFPGGHSGAMEVPGPFALELRKLFDRL